ncbi:unnamed protein product, partial [Hapterophycus canaliculatus]
MMQEDRDIRDIRAGLTLREDRVKDAETKTRGQHDYRFVLQYFSTSRDLHRTLVANVNYLANEVEQLRANMDHSSESLSIMEQQLVELETKYDRVVGGLVHREAFQLTLEGALYGMINEGHATLKTAQRMASELLGGMEHGPDGYDFIASDSAHENNASNDEQDKDAPSSPGGFMDSTGRSTVGLAAVDQVEGQRRLEVHDANPMNASVNSKDNGGAKWTAPRSGGAFDLFRSNESGVGSRDQHRASSTAT